MWTMFQNRNHLRNHYGYEMKVRQITAVIRQSKKKNPSLDSITGWICSGLSLSDLLATAKVTNHKNYIVWSEFQNWILQLCNLQLVLFPQDVIYGIIRQLSPPCLALNHLIRLRKYFLYVNALNNEKSSLTDFKRLVQDKIELEKYVALTSGQQKLFFAKWQNFTHIIVGCR